MSVVFQFKRGTASEWNTINPILAEGEMGVVLDSGTYRVGNGVDAWNDLPAYTLQPEVANLVFDNVTTEPTSIADTLTLYSKDIAGRSMLKWVGPSGLDVVAQPAFFNNSIIMLAPNTTTTMSAFGTPSPTFTGTASTPAIITGSGMRLGMRRTTITSAATAGSVAQVRTTAYQCYRGDAAGLGGFFFNVRFACPTITSDAHFQIGLFGSTSLTAATTPSAQLNWIGCGFDATDSNLQVFYNGAAGSATKVDLGANFPRGTDAVFDLTLFSPPNGSFIGYRVKRIDASYDTSGTITTNIPAASTLLAFHSKLNNNATASAVVTELMRVYIETDT